MRQNLKALVVWMIVLASGMAPGQTSGTDNDGIQTAQRHYEGGQFDQAVAAYEKLMIRHRQNGHILYNLGNAYYKNGQRGAAIAAYLNAKRLLPRDPDVMANLLYVARQTNIGTSPMEILGPAPALAPFVKSLNQRELIWTVVALASFFLILAGLTLWDPARRLRRLAAGVAFLGIYAGVGLYLKVERESHPIGAIQVALATAYAGPQKDGAFPEVFKLQEGYPVRVLEKRATWNLVQLPDGRKGWLDAAAVATLSGDKFLPSPDSHDPV